MRIIRWTLFTFLLGIAALAQAQANRTFVSSLGDDNNVCSTTSPCRTFAGALAKTAAGGEILALDTGGFGSYQVNTLNITKSITIDGNGTRASMTASTVDGIVISDPGFNQIEVTLRNFSINGIGTGLDGIRFASGKRLTIEGVDIYGFTGRGINIQTSSNAYVLLNNVRVQDIGGIGINVVPTGGLFLTAKNIRVFESQTTSGMFLNGAVTAIISDSEFANSPFGAGVTIASTAKVALDGVRATGNKWGVWNYSGSPTTRLKDCVLIGNILYDALRSAGTMTAFQSNVIDSASGVTSAPPM